MDLTAFLNFDNNFDKQGSQLMRALIFSPFAGLREHFNLLFFFDFHWTKASSTLDGCRWRLVNVNAFVVPTVVASGQDDTRCGP